MKSKLPNSRKRVVLVVPYDEEWQVQFEQIRDLLATYLGSLILSIEHVGSTSVPGLAAKPILDIDVIIRSRDDLDETINELSKLGYDHKGDLGIVGREAFSRRDEKVPWDGTGYVWQTLHHLYVCAQTSGELVRHLIFRDYLREHPLDVSEYAEVKITAASNHRQDIEGYMAEKAECIEKILCKAKVVENEVVQYLDSLGKGK
ncbi:MAG: GrpB family protein [Calditrichaeota bacterium]|nr:GrpB family protein [Calditrichota bacterium]MBT7789759.1 GrpB family protein [Calditrichota bacterium]